MAAQSVGKESNGFKKNKKGLPFKGYVDKPQQGEAVKRMTRSGHLEEGGRSKGLVCCLTVRQCLSIALMIAAGFKG